MKSEILMRIASLQINPGHVEEKRRLSAAMIKSWLCVLVHQSVFAKSTWKQTLNSSNKCNDYQNPLHEILNTLRYKLYNLGPVAWACCVNCSYQITAVCFRPPVFAKSTWKQILNSAGSPPVLSLLIMSEDSTQMYLFCQHELWIVGRTFESFKHGLVGSCCWIIQNTGCLPSRHS